MYLKRLHLTGDMESLAALPTGKKLMINTINAYSFVTAKSDKKFNDALSASDILIPDGMSVVWGCRMLGSKPRPSRRISGWDLFEFEMENLNRRGGKCFFMGSSEKILSLIRQKGADIYPNIEIFTYSPPYKDEFTDEDNEAICKSINNVKPDLLWIGLSAPKQEKWVHHNLDKLDIDCHIGSIGAVFSFFAGTEKRAPEKWQKSGFEWLYRLIHDPKRLWKRYIIGNARFAGYLIGEIFISRETEKGTVKATTPE